MKAGEPRRWILGLGFAALAAAWAGPLPGLVPASFTAHMAMHVLVVAVAAPLLALGVAGSRFDPAMRAPALFAPLPAAIIEMLVIWSWHAPLLHDASRSQTAALMLEQGSFLLAGLLVWLSAFGGDRGQQPARAAAGIIGLLLTSMHMTLLGALLTLSPRLLYVHAHTGAAGTAMLEDMQLGGMLMLLGGGTAYLAGGLYLLAGLLRYNRGQELP
ncbi:MAG: cytochrome c oxidase assembly protein [Thiogranum sp.]|nr:cytochrome c oxidase assembly protein [Thiogranum sp.]